jgi:hypothetical protein
VIVTTYTADGKKVRKPMGYAGGKCNAATAPYEKREIGGQVRKTPTPEALMDETATSQAATQKIGG